MFTITTRKGPWVLTISKPLRDTLCNGLYGLRPNWLLFQASGERVGISQVEVSERVGKSAILVCKRFQKV